MKEILNAAGYEHTKAKLSKLEQRLANLDQRTDLKPQHLAEARRSCMMMIAQYRRDLKLYEAAHPEAPAAP
jgi:hypothetical protein